NRKSIRPDQRRVGNNGNQRHRAVQKSSKSNSNDAASNQHPFGRPTRLITYGNIPITNNTFLDGKEVTIDLILEWFKLYMNHIITWNIGELEYLTELIKEVFFGDMIIVLEPRKHGKTVTMLGLFAFWVIELKRTILVLVSDWSAQKRIFYGLRHVFKRDDVREFYGDLIQSESASDFTIMYDPILQGGSLDPFVRIASFMGKWVGTHADWTHQEDVQQTIPVSDRTRANLIDNYDDNLQDLSEKNTASATRKGELDYYSELFKRGWKPLHRKAVEFIKGDFPSENDFLYEEYEYDEERYKNPIGLKESYLSTVEYRILGCPDFPFDKLMIRYWRNPDSFFTQFQNEAVTKRAKFFDGANIEVIDPYRFGELVNRRYEFIDPAFSEKKSSSSSKVAILILVPFQNQFIIEDIVIRHMSPNELDEWGVDLYDQYNPNESKIEDDFSQITSRSKGYSQLLKLRGMSKFYNRAFGSKDQRIQQLYGYAFRSQIKIYATATDRVEFMRQWRSYNKDGKHGFDGLDILASGIRILFNKFNTNKRSRGVRVV
ncbi:hypothetical protein LCGC14_1948110, partial [marine sediment metagenome]